LFPAILFVFGCGCGYVGEPLPPLLNIPQAVDDLAAVQRGSRIVVQFTLPKLTTEGVAVKPPVQWDLRAGEAGTGEFHIEQWAARAQILNHGAVENGRVRYEVPAAAWIGKDIVLGVRVTGARGRPSDWSKLVTITVIAPPAMPRELKVDSVPEGVRLSWSGAGPAYRVFRRADGEEGFRAMGDTAAREFVDRGTEYGKTYRYAVQTIAKTGTGEVESELSPPRPITPADLFPPAIPTGLQAVPTPNTIELAWERDTEPDLAGYRIYRAAAGGEFEKIGETGETTSYSDRQVESGKQYRYAVSAFDKSGNESKRSEPIELMAQ
jgi:hypothetical protein